MQTDANEQGEVRQRQRERESKPELCLRWLTLPPQQAKCNDKHWLRQSESESEREDNNRLA